MMHPMWQMFMLIALAELLIGIPIYLAVRRMRRKG